MPQTSGTLKVFLRGSNETEPLGFIKNNWFYEGRRGWPTGQIIGHEFHYCGVYAGTIEGNILTRLDDGTQFELIPE